MEKQLGKEEYNYISQADKAFIVAFDTEMKRLGYVAETEISPGYCWGKHMVIYRKAGVKSKKSYARIYMREEDIVLRLYFSGVDKHAAVIENAPDFIREAFIGAFAQCEHCSSKEGCIHQKCYTLQNKKYVICDGRAFWFVQPQKEQLPECLRLFSAFYPTKKRHKLS